MSCKLEIPLAQHGCEINTHGLGELVYVLSHMEMNLLPHITLQTVLQRF